MFPPVTIRRLSILLALVAAAVTVLAVPAPAAAATPCWKRLINDWYDGRIDNVYPVKCYRDAIRHLPPDVESYSDAREAIERALLGAINKKHRAGESVGPNTPVPVTPRTGGTTSTIEPGNPDDDPGSGNEAGPPAGNDSDSGDGPVGFLKPANADSVPIPLLVLAGLAFLLLAAAAAGFVTRRLQARRVRVSPAPPKRDTP